MLKLLGLGASFLVGMLVLAAPAYLLPGPFTPAAKQPVAFNHQKHVAAGWKCANCHPYTDQQWFAGLPRAKDCVDCHDKEAPKHPDNARMRAATDEMRHMVDAGKDWQWSEVHYVPSYVLFSHRRHVTLAKLDCALCHGDVKQMAQPFIRSAFPPYGVNKMNWCLRCHEQRHANTDCLACHR